VVLPFVILVCMLGLAVIYLLVRAEWSVPGLLVLGLLLIIPNDQCVNVFNNIWTKNVGASPLMYVPNMFIIIHGAASLVGIRRRIQRACSGVLSMAALALGIGHMTRVVW